MKKKKIFFLVIFLILLIGIIGVSYALLQKDIIGSNGKIIYKIGDLEVKLDESGSKDISLTNVTPTEDSDGISNEPYSFSIVNNGVTDLKYTIYLEDDKEAKNKCGTDCELVPYKFIRYNLSNDSESLKTSNLSTTSNALYTGTIKSKSTDKFNLRVWLSIDVDNTAMNKYYFGKIKVVVGQSDSYCKDNGFNTLSDCMLVMNNHESSVDIAKTNIKAKGTPDFSKTATTDEGLFMAEDDEGESYYYRGAVKNNYVSFAGFIWRIIRRNGDVIIRLIYAGKKTSDKGEAATIGKSQFNSKYWDPTYVGYKYNENFVLHLDNKQVSNNGFVNTITYNFGTEYTFNQETKKFYLSGEIKPLMWKSNYNDIVSKYKYTCFSSECNIIYKVTGYVNDNVVSIQPINYGSKNYEDTLLNSTNSTIENTINTWYKKNLIKYSNYLFDSVFCNDRSISKGTGFKVDEQTNYAAWYRILNNSPSLKCLQTTDKFKVSNTNAKLDYPIALLTADELVLAGGKSYKDSIYHDNKKFYLYIGDLAYFLLTPSYFDSTYSSRALVFGLTAGGTLHPGHDISNRFGVRPVINLKPDITISSGDGTATAPYKID